MTMQSQSDMNMNCRCGNQDLDDRNQQHPVGDVMLNFQSLLHYKTLHMGCLYRLVKNVDPSCTKAAGFCDDIGIAHVRRVVQKTAVRQSIDVGDNIVIVDLDSRKEDPYQVYTYTCIRYIYIYKVHVHI